MLTKRDFRYNFLLLRLISALRILPVDFDSKQGILKVPHSPWKRRISHGIFALVFIHGCYIHFRLLQLLLYSHDIVRHHLVFHADVSSAALMIQGWYLVCFVLNPETFVALFNEIFAVNVIEDDVACSSPEFRAKGEALSRQELFALAMPFMIVLTAMLVFSVFIYDPSMPFLLYSSLPQVYKTDDWFLFLLSEEALFLAFIIFNAWIVLNAQLLFFEKVINSLKHMKSSTKRSSEAVVIVAYEQLREIQLKVSLFNNVNRLIVLSFKLFCITMSTLNGYCTIVYFSADPIFGTTYYVVFVASCILYSIIYERAFSIPKMVGRAKSIVLLMARTEVRSTGFKRRMEMSLWSVPEVGIEVGHFHTFERVATPVFVDYVLRNVAGLLVMHLKN